MRVTDRIRALYDAGDVQSARQLTQAVVRNRSDVTVSLSEGELVVSVPGFTGRHPVSVRAKRSDERTDSALVDVGSGTYRPDDGPDVDATVRSLWDAAESTAVPVLYPAVSERGFVDLHTIIYPTGRSEVRYREDGLSAPPSDTASTGQMGTRLLDSVRRLIP